MKTDRLWVRTLALFLCVSIAAGPAFPLVAKAEDVENFTFADMATAPVGGPGAGSSRTPKQREVPVGPDGSFAHSYPMQVPPGRIGMTPTLALTYSSGNARHSGVAGAGWSFSLPKIERDVKNGLRLGPGPSYKSDAFDGPSGRIVAATGVAANILGPPVAPGAEIYVLEREMEPVRYEWIASEDRWVEHLPRGRKRYFGGANGLASARITNPLGTFAWLLVRESDAFGNTIDYEYHSQPGGNSLSAVPIVSAIRWGANASAGLSHVFEARTAIEPALQREIDLLNGQVELRNRIQSIIVGRSDVSEEYWRYTLAYSTSRDTGRELLSTVTRSAPGETDRSTVFNYSRNDGLANGSFFGPVQNLPDGVYNDVRYQHGQPDLSADASEAKANARTPKGRRGGYKWLDFDADGDLDTIYHPAGLASQSSRLRVDSSKEQTSIGWRAWSDADLHDLPNSEINSLSDLDRDGDIDALGIEAKEVRGYVRAGANSGNMNDPSGTMAVPGANGGVPAEYVCETSLVCNSFCGNSDYWNACGSVDPVGPDFIDYQSGYPGSEVEWDASWGQPYNVDSWGPTGYVPPAGYVQGADGYYYDPLEEPPPGEAIRPYCGCVPICLDNTCLLQPVEPPLAAPEDIELGDAPEGPRAWIALNQSRPGGTIGSRQIIFRDWPEHVLERYSVRYTAVNRAESFSISAFDLTQGDLDADGKDDSVLTKYKFFPFAGAQQNPTTTYAPRTYLTRGEHVINDATNTFLDGEAPNTAFTESLIEALSPNGRDGCVAEFQCLFEALTRPREYSSLESCGLAIDQCLANSKYPGGTDFNSLLLDVNGDRLADLVVAEPPDASNTCVEGHRVYLNTGDGWDVWSDHGASAVPDESWSADPAGSGTNQALSLLRNREPHCFYHGLEEHRSDLQNLPMSAASFADLNADGRLDLVFAWLDRDTAQRYHRVFLNTGSGFREPSSSFAQNYAGTNLFPNTFALTGVKWSPGTISAAPPGYWKADWTDASRLTDIDGDGLVDIAFMGACTVGQAGVTCTPATWRKNISVMPDTLTAIYEGSGARTMVSYLWSGSEAARSGNRVVSEHLSPNLVVDEVRHAAGFGADYPTDIVTLSYRNQRLSETSREPIGFEEVAAHFQNSFAGLNRESITVTTTYDIEAQPAASPLPVEHAFRGLPILVEEVSGQYTRRTRREWRAAPLGDHAVAVREKRTEREECLGATCLASRSDVTTFDRFGYPAELLEGQIQNGGFVSSTILRTPTTYAHDSTLWILGRPSHKTRFGRTQDVKGAAQSDARLEEWSWGYVGPELKTESRLGIAPAACGKSAANDTTTFRYFPSGQLSSVTRGSRVIEFAYDDYDLYFTVRTVDVTRFVDGQSTGTNTLAESYEYDLRTGAETKVTRPDGSAWETTHDSVGRPLEAFGPNHALLKSSTYSDAHPAFVDEVVHLNGTQRLTRRTHLDGRGEVLAVIEGSGATMIRRSLNRRDAFGRVVESYGPSTPTDMNDLSPGNASVTSYLFDGFDRLTQEILPGQRTRTVAYAPGAETEVNARNFAVYRAFDFAGRLTKVRYHAGATVATAVIAEHTNTYDAAGRLVALQDPDGAIRNFERDAAGRIHHFNLPHSTAVQPPSFTACYDREDRLATFATPAGRSVSILRDELGREVHSESSYGSISTAAFKSYDGNMSGQGRLTRVSDGSGAYELEYDAFGNQARLVTKLDPALVAGSPNIPSEYAAKFVHGNQGQLLLVEVTANTSAGEINLGTLSYTHDDFGRPKTLTSGGVGGDVVVGSNLIYELDDKLQSLTLGNGIDAAWTYHADQRHLTSVEYISAGTRVARVAYSSVDAHGNILDEERWRGTSQARLVRKRHTFDALDRLSWTEITDPSGTRASTMQYSAGGNVLSSTGETYFYDEAPHAGAATRVTSASLQRRLDYDADGWLQKDTQRFVASGETETRQLSFDGAGCAAEVASRRTSARGQVLADRVTTHVCGPDGSRIARLTRDNLSGRVNRVLEIAGVGEIRPDDGVLLKRPQINQTVVLEEARDLSSGTRVAAESGYLLQDMRGSVLARTQFATGSTLLREGDYDAWGNALSVSGLAVPRHGFVNEEPDPGDGYVHLGRRVYDPTLRRWLTPDPLVSGSPEIDADDGRQLNLYAYAANNPVRLVDRSGGYAGDIESNDELARLVFSMLPVLPAVIDAQNDVAAAIDAAFDPKVPGYVVAVHISLAVSDTAFAVLDVLSGGISSASGGGVARGQLRAEAKGAVRAETRAIIKEDLKRVHATYTKAHPTTGEVYSGRASGYGTAEEVVAARDASHHKTKEGFGPAVLDKSSTNRDAVRGREQQLIDANGGAKSQGGTSGNAINSISDRNPKRERYLEASGREIW